MKKVMTLFCAAAIASTPFVGTAQALETETSSTSTIEKEAEVEQQKDETQNKDLKVLTLEDVLKRGLENDKSLILLEYQLESSKNQLLDTEDDKRDTQKDIKDLEETLDELREMRDKLQGGERAGVYDAIESYEDAMKEIEKAIEALKSGQVTLQLQTEGAKEGMTLQLTSAYMNLLSSQDQINFMKKSIQSAADNVKKAERLFEYGMGSKDDIDQAKRAQTNLEKQLEQKEKDYYYNLAALTFDIDVNYNPDLALTRVETTIEDAETVLAAAIANAIERVEKKTDVSEEGAKAESTNTVAEEEKTDAIEDGIVDESTDNTDINVKDYETLIQGTFKMMEANEKLELAKYNRDEVYEDDDSDKYDEQAEDYNVKIAEEQIIQLYEQLTKKIDSLNHNIKTSKFNYEEAARKLEDAQKDISNLEKKYELGVIAKYDYEQAKLQLDELNLNVAIAKTNYFLVQQSIEALGKGYIQ
ncbi:TolC family protein [Priestia abyssalis]|uniref:TolC family protein n=1 Tax=Priestia abyssalis TaxID=1221450 RepID=UPI00099538DD|nr:TolC family protein [Priestia abyssalis]